jgi:uncharacterized Zn finger protein (UPF0148 family)
MRDELRKSKCCAFCSLERRALHQFFDGLLYEKVTDPGIRSSLVRSGGFCPRHAHILAGFGDALGTAILYEDQVKLRLEALEKMKTPVVSRRALHKSDRRGHMVCPACRFEEKKQQAHAQTLLQGLSDPEMADAFASSPGLCFLHFTLVMNEEQHSEEKRILIEVQKEKLKTLLHQLKEFQGKQDYRRSAEESSEEKDSWQRAIEFVSGVKNVF